MSDSRIKDVIVVGGGISGLTAAWHLGNAGLDIALLEATKSVGGVMQTHYRDGFLLERGPFNIMVRDPAFEDLLGAISDRVNVVSADKSAQARFIYRHGRLIKVPTGPLALMTSPILSLRGKCRAIMGLFLSRRGAETDYTLEEFAVRRFGREVADTMLSAVISGILAGDISKLSAKACFPALGRFDRISRSPLGYELSRLFAGEKKRKRRWKGLVSFDRGLGAIGDAIAVRLGDNLIANCRVDSIARAAGGFTLHCTRRGDEHTYRCRRLVMALPAAAAGRLLAPIQAGASLELERIKSASLAVLNLGFRSRDVGHPMQGFGFLVPRNEPNFAPMGVLWADSAFPHHGRPDHRLIRVFMGEARTPAVNSWSDEELANTAMDSLRDPLQLRGEPMLIDVNRFPNAIPQYHLGHLDRIERVRKLCGTIPRLHLVGNYLEGVSINDCVRLSTRVANEIIDVERNQPRAAVPSRRVDETVLKT
ncbi:MAG: protoporphyrinogen oxidase [Planctomycetes bacterium]|nr:protoporphyrinogen oxidase [Planctomycetota bacterium]